MGHFPQVAPRARRGDVRACHAGEARRVRAPVDVDAPGVAVAEYPPPAGHAPRRPAGPVVRTRREWIAPAIFHGARARSVHPVSPEPLYPAGQAPHVRPPGVFVHVVPSRHPPLFVAHSSTSAHVSPSPSYPIGQDPQVNPSFGGAASVQSTPAKHGEFAHPSTFAHSASWSFGSRPYPLGQGPHVASPVTSSARALRRGVAPAVLDEARVFLARLAVSELPRGAFPARPAHRRCLIVLAVHARGAHDYRRTRRNQHQVPSPSYPAGHAPHTEFPFASSEQVTSLWHPPLRTSHPLDLTHFVSPVPLYPAGRAPHVRPPPCLCTGSADRSHRYASRTRRCPRTSRRRRRSRRDTRRTSARR